MRTPQIAALVELLSVHDPDGLLRLRNNYGASRGILSGGLKLGEQASPGVGAPQSIQPVYVDTALTALRAMRGRVQPNLEFARARLAQAKRLRLAGALITAITGAGLLTAIFSNWDNLVKAGGAILNLCGSACVVIAAYLEGPLEGDKRSVSDVFETLIKAVVDTDSLIDALDIDLKTGRFTSDVADQVQRANALAAELREMEIRLRCR